ncbi:ACP S-malonyltransferase [Engelhardtia mirabilis]
MNEAIILPGQGAQFPGMGQDWYEAYPKARDLFDRADGVLGFALTEACFHGGVDVHRTDIAQPGIFTTSAAILTVLSDNGLELGSASMTAGLSLGEYTALWVAGSLSFEDALRLVRLRGEAMQAASEATPSSMTSLIGADLAVAEKLAAMGAEAGICSVANLNCPGQVVVSGELAALDIVESHASDHGVRRAMRLNVAGGFHSECMRPAADRLAAALAEVTVQAPRIPFVTNVTGAPVSDPGQIVSHLANQVCSPVLWEQSMRWALGQGHTQFLEPGPGQVLAGLMKKIDRGATVRSAAHPEDAETA